MYIYRCPVGTFSPNTGNSLLSDCQPCTPGSWCGQAGLSVVSGLCHEGFYCSGSAQSPYQYVQTSTGGPCTVGHYCLPGTAIPTPCPAGTYNSNTMATGNVTLAGYNYICTLCPSGRVCERTGLTAPSSLCPAGFWCVSGASSLIPVCSGMKCLHMYGVCPIGHYCPQATSTPIPCTSGTFMNHTGAVTCSSCPSGFYCDATVSTSQYLSCPQGFYCPYGTALDFQPCAAGTYGSQSGLRSLSDCTKCDIGTYNPSISSTSSDACLPCPAAYFCNHIGISNYSHWPCPVGHFCVEKTVISISCPEGSYRPTLYGAAVSDCLQCPVGRLCEGKGAFSTEACPSGRFCPAGSFASIPCPESFYCPANATAPILCPSAYFCSLGSSSPSPCIRGSYCPSRSSQPTLCPLGYKAASTSYNSTFILLDSVANACERCEAGFYGNDEARLNCFVGLKGYVYLGGTTTAHPSNITQDRGYVCPLGAYCPAKSISTILCPAGTFQPSLGQGDASSCQACPSGTYQNTAGSSTCLSCSASSFSDPGSIQCTCIGRNRAFQSGDGWCVCKPGYEFIDTITQVVSTDADGMYDCQPIVYPRCSSPQQRDSTGNCVNPDSYCASICGFGGGVLSPTTGLCACNEVVHLDDVCTSNCRASAVTMSCNRNPNGDSIIITDPITSQVESVALSSLNLLGSPTCQYSNSHIYSMSTANGTFTGIYGLGFAIASKSTRSVNRRLATIADFVYLSSSSSLPSAISFSGLGSSRRLQYTILLNTSTYPQIPKPLVCINQNDTIVFDIDDQNYPVYSKDSLINSNPNFDYSSFRNLQTLASQSRVLTNFSFTFVSSGIFEFKMSNSNANLIIIVTSPSVQCVTAGVFVEASQTNMIKSGVSSTNTLVLSPDWTLVIGLVVGVFLLINLVAGCLYYVRKNSWDIVSTSSQQSYRSKYNMRKQALRSTSGNTTNNNMSFAMRRSDSMVVPTDLDSFSPVGIATDDEDPLVAESIAVGGPQEPVSNKSWRVIPATQEFGADSNNDDGDGVDGKEMEEYFEEEDNRFSELFRHMQSNQKTLDHQYSSHSDKLHELQQTLKNEIKELKLLLTMKQPQNEPSSKPSQNSDSVQRSKVFHDQGVESFYTTAQGSIKATDDDKTSDTVADPLSAINSDKIIDELLDDTNLTIEQKDIVLDTRESDYKRLTALLDMETRIYEEFKHETETKKEKLFDTERVDDDDADSDVDDSRSHTGVSDLRSASKTKIRGIKSRVPKTSEHVIDQNSNSTLWKKKVQSVFDKVTKLGLSDIERENYCFEELFSNSNSSGFPDNTLQETIDRVQSRRHFSEMNALLSQLFTERTISLQSGVETLNDKKLAECIHLVQSSAAENTDSETIHTRVAALEEKYREKQRVLEFDIITDLETSHEQNQLILRRQQLDETSDALAKYCTDDQQGRQMTSGSSDSSSFGFIEKEMNEYKDQLESAKNTRLEKFKVARVEIEKKLQQEHDVESVKVQEQILAEKKRKAERKLEWRQKELLWQQEALSKQQNSQSDELINFEDQRNIENEKRVTEELKEQERLVQKAKMHSRLKHRRSSRKLGNTWIHILGNSFNSLPPSESSAKQSTTTSSQIHCNTDVAVPVIVPSKPTGSFTRQFVSESSILKSSQLDTIDVKQNSPKERQHCDHNTDIISSIQAIETKLEKIEKLLATLDRLATTTSVPSIAKDDNTTSVVATISNPTSAMPFPSSTVNDELIPGSALELVDESVITIEERKKLEFGHRLARMIGLRGLKLVVASSISIDKKASSTSITTANTFSRHYKYMRDSNILVVHQEQLASSGNFELILIHALSHIIVNPFNLSDDADPSFVSEFYKNLRLLSQDLFRMSLATRDISIKDTNSTTAVTRSRPQIRKSTSFDSIFEGNKELKSHH